MKQLALTLLIASLLLTTACQQSDRVASSVDNRTAQSTSQSQSPTNTVPPSSEVWKIKEGSIYDGDTLRVVKGSEELKIRLCGIDAPEKKQDLGVASRDYLRSLVQRKWLKSQKLECGRIQIVNHLGSGGKLISEDYLLYQS